MFNKNFGGKKFKSYTLDNILNIFNLSHKSIFFLKIDVEGQESNVLKGAQNTLKNTILIKKTLLI